MSTELQLLEPDKVNADIFFDREPVQTDWDCLRCQVLEHSISSHGALEEVKAFEPLREEDPRAHAHWIAQQVLRLALLHEAGKPLELNELCQSCGVHKADPLFKNECLHCRELHKQHPDTGGRGSCEYLAPHYNQRSHAWGLLYYWNHSSRDEPFMFWLADYFKTRRDALLAMMPVKLYEQWLDVKYNGLYACWRSYSRLLPINEVMTMELPLTPEKLRAHLRAVIGKDMQDEHAVMRYVVGNALDDHKRSERD